MNHNIDPMAWVAGLLAVITAINLIMSLANNVRRERDVLTAPDMERDRRISDLEHTVEEIKRYMSRDDERIKELEEGNKLMQKMLVALGRHSIDGNHTDELKKASDELNDFIFR